MKMTYDQLCDPRYLFPDVFDQRHLYPDYGVMVDWTESKAHLFGISAYLSNNFREENELNISMLYARLATKSLSDKIHGIEPIDYRETYGMLLYPGAFPSEMVDYNSEETPIAILHYYMKDWYKNHKLNLQFLVNLVAEQPQPLWKRISEFIMRPDTFLRHNTYNSEVKHSLDSYYNFGCFYPDDLPVEMRLADLQRTGNEFVLGDYLDDSDF
jgi:hypothetical protein